jgi:hypothetical protein
VEVHFVTVKVSVVRGTNCKVKPEGVTLHNTNFVDHHGHAVQRRLSVEDSNVTIDQVSLNEQTWLRVSISVNGRKSVFDTRGVAPLIGWAATVWAANLEVFWEWFWVSLVGLCQIPHPSVVELCATVIFRKAMTVKGFATKVCEGCVIVHNVRCFGGTIGCDGNLRLNDQTREEVWCRQHRVDVEATSRLVVTLRVVASESSVDQSASLIDTDTSAVTADDVVHTRVNIRTTEDHLAHLLSVSRGHTDRDGQFLCNLGWHTNFVHAEVWIWGDDRPSTEVDTLTGQVATESSFLPLESLSERLEGSAGAVACRWDA